ncbi:flagellar basal body rod C-terminal domain-containing protein [Arthrobacter sp. AL08]|uniref:flagellar basal body rod protein FlgC n=1 Tax=Micrococcaceae TaxID=1268 RepID=UPI001CFFCF3C|nr:MULTISPECIES: flagellar basal body rod C-terminal domain-containing protein [Micrococcaceae]MCB5283771.1 Flagellar basal-body rod protein FlgC [Arthrobacter sp. ES1]MDD1475662.1 flagellar basal body rod C-terminal domain-containing protein [Arthrobacter sp. H16F315]MDI3242935.1 flagellar basal body rod C-terminal domain-containing protein [Arthrobacter sp. AL05]MDI3278995.1 flagellar basal body rod C-terminal domain-containing protein [Arthrobacter sp. AL08]MDJ0353358.1 flagellar basal body
MTFDAIGIAGSALTVHRKWLDAVSDNLANMNNVSRTSGPAFQAKYVEAGEGADLTGVYVKSTQLGNGEGRIVYQPDHPLADANGNVKYPDIDMAEQMGALIIAQRGYQANAQVVDRARESYMAALEIGRS